jgi:hypothetical protein
VAVHAVVGVHDPVVGPSPIVQPPRKCVIGMKISLTPLAVKPSIGWPIVEHLCRNGYRRRVGGLHLPTSPSTARARCA